MSDKKLIFKELRKKAGPFARKIAPVYNALNWEWYIDKESGNQIPDVVDIALNIMGLIDGLEKKNQLYISTGGISVSIEEETPGILMGKIEFKIVEEIYEDEIGEIV